MFSLFPNRHSIFWWWLLHWFEVLVLIWALILMLIFLIFTLLWKRNYFFRFFASFSDRILWFSDFYASNPHSSYIGTLLRSITFDIDILFWLKSKIIKRRGNIRTKEHIWFLLLWWFFNKARENVQFFQVYPKFTPLILLKNSPFYLVLLLYFNTHKTS